jgi:hypothetical protein
MDMKLYKQHLKTHLKESDAKADAQRLIQRLDEYERASKNLLTAWEDLIDSSNSSDDVITPDGYPFGESFDEVVQGVTAFVKSFKNLLRKVR